LLLAGLAPGASRCAAQETRYYVENGVTYRETRQTLQQPVWTTEYQSRQQTVLRPRVTSEHRDVTRSWYVPVTEYSWQQRWERGWNPFRPPVLTQRYLPQTRWELRSDTVRVPVTRYDYVPETTTVQTPVTVQRYADQQIVTRVPVGGPAPASGAGGAQVAGDPFAQPSAGLAVGGVARLDRDPPATGWRPSGTVTR
jgi:hypothetical protein